MRELVLETIIEQPDMEIVAEIKNEGEILHAFGGTHPDFLIISLDESNRRPSLCDTWLVRYPKMKILALAPERSVLSFLGLIRYSPSQVEASQAGMLSTMRRKSQYVGG